MKEKRQSQEWFFMRTCLPPLKESRFDSQKSSLSSEEMYERYLLSLTDEQFEKAFPVVEIPSDGGPIVTGDPVIDKMERELWEKNNGAVKPLR